MVIRAESSGQRHGGGNYAKISIDGRDIEFLADEETG